VIIIEVHPAGEEAVDVDDIRYVGPAKFACMGHLFTVDSVPARIRALTFS
jgi:hypothetical protein